jgi:drug/metabolite transporter (DMT)-like permease
MSTWVALLWLAIANIIWGASHAVGKVATDSFDPVLLAGLRVVIATGIFWGLRISRIAPAEIIPARQRWQLAALGLVAVAAAQMLDYSGLALTTATDSSLMIIGEVIFTAILAVVIAKEHLGWQRAIGLAIGIVGVVVLTLGGSPNSEYAPNRALGNTLVLGALFCEAIFTVIGASIAQRYHPLTVMRWTYTGSLVIWVPVIIYHVAMGIFPHVGWDAWLAVAYVAVFTSVISYFLWFWVLRSAGSSLGAISLFIQPVVGACLGLFVLREPSSPGLYMGAALIFVALGFATYGQSDHTS